MNDFRMGYPAVYLALLEPEVKPSLYTPSRVRLTAAEETERRAQDRVAYGYDILPVATAPAEKINWPTRALWQGRSGLFYTLFDGRCWVLDSNGGAIAMEYEHTDLRAWMSSMAKRFNFTGTERRPPEEEIPVDAIAFYGSESPVFIRMGPEGQVQIRYSNSCTQYDWTDTATSDWAFRQYMCTAL